MLSISGLGSYLWNDYKSLSQNTQLFFVIAKCPKCGLEEKITPTKTTLSDTNWSFINHIEEKILVWVEGWAKTGCPLCSGVVTFHFGIHCDGGVIVGPYDDVFDDSWWNFVLEK